MQVQTEGWGLAGADRAGCGVSNSKTRGKSTAKGRRFAPSFYPALPRWAKLCRAYGAGGLAGCRSCGGVYGNSQTLRYRVLFRRVRQDVGVGRNRIFQLDALDLEEVAV